MDFDEEKIVASGGICAPIAVELLLPVFNAARGGIVFSGVTEPAHTGDVLYLEGGSLQGGVIDYEGSDDEGPGMTIDELLGAIDEMLPRSADA